MKHPDGRGTVVPLVEDLDSALPERLAVGLHREPMQESPLAMDPSGPPGIRPEQKGIFHKGHGTSWLNSRMVQEQLVGVDESEFHA